MAAGVYLLADTLIETGQLVIIFVLGVDGLAARRQFVDDTHIEVAIDGHGKCTGDRGGGHHQHMGGIGALAPQTCTLGNTEAVLFVDDGKAKAVKLNWLFDDGMGAHQYVDAAVGKSGKSFLATFALDHACEQFHPDVHIVKKFPNRDKVLLGQNFRRGHNTGLVTIVESYQCRHQGNKGLSRPYIALKQAVHLAATFHVTKYLTDDTLLCLCQVEGKVLTVKIIKEGTYALHLMATIAATVVAGIPDNVELDIE